MNNQLRIERGLDVLRDREVLLSSTLSKPAKPAKAAKVSRANPIAVLMRGN